jgi:hypothetical protein
MTEEEINAKCDAIRQIAYDLHVYLGVGYLEKVYENGLAHRLAKAGFNVEMINFGSHKFETRKLARPHTPASPVLCG